MDTGIRARQGIFCLSSREKKILIKAYSAVGDFGDCLRITIGEKQYMKVFAEALFQLDQ